MLAVLFGICMWLQLSTLRTFLQQGIQATDWQHLIELGMEFAQRMFPESQVLCFWHSMISSQWELLSNTLSKPNTSFCLDMHILNQVVANNPAIIQYEQLPKELGQSNLLAAPIFTIKPKKLQGILGITLPIANLNNRFLLGMLASEISLALAHLQFQEQAKYDPLSRVLSRRYFFRYLAKKMQDCAQHKLGLLMLDIDYFKSVNDTLSHLAGDMVLEQFGTLLQKMAHADDLVGKYGGEEFMMLLEGDPQKNIERAEFIREQIAITPFAIQHPKEQKIYISASLGLSFHGPEEALAQWIERTDQALYRAKSKGRNCVVADSLYLASQ